MEPQAEPHMGPQTEPQVEPQTEPRLQSSELHHKTVLMTALPPLFENRYVCKDDPGNGLLGKSFID